MKTEIAAIDNVKIYKYREIRQATDDFSAENKIGEGGFGSVYKVNEKTQLLSHSLFTFSLHLFKSLRKKILCLGPS